MLDRLAEEQEARLEALDRVMEEDPNLTPEQAEDLLEERRAEFLISLAEQRRDDYL
jgi:hypothetical protein